jgi:hypothetical protein
VLVKLQELSIGNEKNAPVRKLRVSEFFNRPIETQAELDKVLDLIRDSLQKCIDEGAIVILESLSKVGENSWQKLFRLMKLRIPSPH